MIKNRPSAHNKRIHKKLIGDLPSHILLKVTDVERDVFCGSKPLHAM